VLSTIFLTITILLRGPTVAKVSSPHVLSQDESSAPDWVVVGLGCRARFGYLISLFLLPELVHGPIAVECSARVRLPQRI
jgi:hypothetical protein